MQIEVECSWDEGKEKGKEVISYDFQPESLFSMEKDDIVRIIKLSQTAPTSGPNALKELEELAKKNENSLYAQRHYYQTLCFFEFEDEAQELMKTMKKKFKDELFVKCSIASDFLKDKNTAKMSEIFNNKEVLIAAFPNRKVFFFEEALFFHDLWCKYYDTIGDEFQKQKHEKFNFLILNTLQTLSVTKS